MSTSPVVGSPVLIAGATGPVTSLAWSPDGLLLATAGGERLGTIDHTIRLWHASGTLAATLKGHTGYVTSLAWSPDGHTLASGAADGTVRLWTATGVLERTLGDAQGPVHQVFNLAWSPDGTVLAVGSIGIPTGLTGSTTLYRADGNLIRRLPGTVATGGKFLNLAWSPDGSMLVMGAVGYKIWRADGSLVGSIPGGTPQWGFDWAPDGKSFAIGDESGYVVLFTPDGTGVQSWQRNGSVSSLAFSPDGTEIALNSNTYLVRLLPIGEPPDSAISISQLEGPPRDSSNVAWSSASDLLASSAAGGDVYLFNQSGIQTSVLRGCPGPIESLAWSSTGDLAAGSANGNVCIWGSSSMP